MTFYDISPPLDEDLAVWPGDTPLSRHVLADIVTGSNIRLSTLTLSVHAGAHADAAGHFARDGAGVSERALHHYWGRCQVVTANVEPGGCVQPHHLAAEVRARRVLVRTSSYPRRTEFNRDFTPFSTAVVEVLDRAGVVLLGIDTPSVDRFDSKDLAVHHAMERCGMAMLEGLILDGVADGLYELSALPLRLVGFDASPVRAVLRALGSEEMT